MNNKGQTLVLFVLLLPLFLMLVALVFESGRLLLIKNEYQDAAYETITYTLNHLEEPNIASKAQKLLESNTDNIGNVQIENQIVTIQINTKEQGVFSFFDNPIYQIDLTYKGYKENGKIKIKE